MLVVGSAAYQLATQKAESHRYNLSDFDTIMSFQEFQDFLGYHQGNIANGKIVSPKHHMITLKECKSGVHRRFDQRNIDIEIAWRGSSGHRLLELVEEDQSLTRREGPTHFASLDLLYTLKMSHRYRGDSPHFRKTMLHIKEMRMRGATIPKSLQGWLALREQETYTKKRPSLMQSKSNFFGEDANKYTYDHDTIHLAVALGDQPAYQLFKDDQAEVMCSKEKWDAQPYEIKLRAVYEEASVLAIERSLIAKKFKASPEVAFDMALEKVCTTITSGYFREFAWENYDEVKSLPEAENCQFVDDFLLGLEKGIVRRA